MFGSQVKVKLERSLYDELTAAAAAAGYATTDELIVHVLEQAVAVQRRAAEKARSRGEIDQQLRGLGYLE